MLESAAAELGHNRDAAILVRNLNEEKATDKKLTALAEQRVNPKSANDSPRRTSPARSDKTRASGRRAAASRRKPMQKKRKTDRRRS